jgi:hypothetical protein
MSMSLNNIITADLNFLTVSLEEHVKMRMLFNSLPDFTYQRYFLGKCVKEVDKKHVYTEKEVSCRKVTYEYSITVQGVHKRICKEALCSTLGIKPYRIDHVCCMMKKHGSPEEDMRGKQSNRPNRVPEWRKNVVRTFIKKLPKYRSHYTRRHNPNRYYPSPLTDNKKNARILYRGMHKMCGGALQIFSQKNSIFAQAPKSGHM